jgi:hypothetical protein
MCERLESIESRPVNIQAMYGFASVRCSENSVGDCYQARPMLNGKHVAHEGVSILNAEGYNTDRTTDFNVLYRIVQPHITVQGSLCELTPLILSCGKV